ncbi:MAG: PrsW family intramembrane metalloprotease [Candidatus Poseidoniales archaeon]|nr:MAG: PrsW family intramembrane metalloprotease [Candidatus Poseidoniales archaeon]
MQGAIAPLTPPPRGIALASKSTPWSVIWSMLGIVVLLYIITQVVVLALFGIFEAEASLTICSIIFLVPLLLLFTFVRRPKLTHLIMATPDITSATNQHQITNSRVLSTPIPTKFSHHLVRDSPPLEMPPTSTLWTVFGITVITAFLGLLPVMLSNNPIWMFIAVLIGVPAWLLGFSLPVHAWWAFSTRHFQLMTSKRDGEQMLIAGMLSTIPAIVINSLLFPLMLITIGIESMEPGSIGEFLILAVSAPFGEELCKAAFVLSLYKLIDSPKRGFQIGFSVGLGFALLENLQYIMISLGGGEYAAFSYSITTIVRGIGSIPGHAFWTGLSGVSIGWYLCTKYGMNSNQIEKDDTKWVVFDGSTGQVIDSEREISPLGQTVKGWLYKPADKVWRLPRSPIIGISLAIIGHSFWNGSSWLIGWLFKDDDILIQLLANLGWIVVMIASLWYIGRNILAAVMHLPS